MSAPRIAGYLLLDQGLDALLRARTRRSVFQPPANGGKDLRTASSTRGANLLSGAWFDILAAAHTGRFAYRATAQSVLQIAQGTLEQVSKKLSSYTATPTPIPVPHNLSPLDASMGILRSLNSILVNYSDRESISSRLRARRIHHLTTLISQVASDRNGVRILDVGGTKEYWSVVPLEFLRTRKVTVTIVNLSGETHQASDDIFTFEEGNGCDLNYVDDSFDIAHSNSVIEHVGRWRDMVAFAANIRRVAPSYYVQTPYFWFPIEPHFMMPFFHWLPEPVRVSMNMRFAMASVVRPDVSRVMEEVIDRLRLLDLKMMQALFPDSSITFERLLFLRKSLIAIRRART